MYITTHGPLGAVQTTETVITELQSNIAVSWLCRSSYIALCGYNFHQLAPHTDLNLLDQKCWCRMRETGIKMREACWKVSFDVFSNRSLAYMECQMQHIATELLLSRVAIVACNNAIACVTRKPSPGVYSILFFLVCVFSSITTPKVERKWWLEWRW